MPEELLLVGPRDVRITAYEETKLNPDEIRAEAVLSGISHGTELNLYRGTSPFHDKQFDPNLRLFVPVSESVMYPAPIGYEWVGRVTEVGSAVSGFALGDLIHLPFGHRATHTARPTERTMIGDIVPLPPTLGLDSAVMLALAGVALRLFTTRISVGDHVAIFGLGVIGLLAVQFARLNGALRIVPWTIPGGALAEAWGGSHWDPLPVTRRGIKWIPRMRCRCGDRTIRQRGSAGVDPLRAEGWNGGGRRLLSGWRRAMPGREWHHNRITMVSSRASGTARTAIIRPGIVRIHATTTSWRQGSFA